MSTTCPETLTIDGVEYVRRDTVQEAATAHDGYPYMIVRADRTGVFAGYLKNRNHQQVVLLKARRLWRWVGAASLSQLAMEGVKNPGECKFPCEVTSVTILDAIELLPVTKQAQDSIAEVPVWKN